MSVEKNKEFHVETKTLHRRTSLLRTDTKKVCCDVFISLTKMVNANSLVIGLSCEKIYTATINGVQKKQVNGI